jgi:uncharacterized protein YcbK (DUF882 family)
MQVTQHFRAQEFACHDGTAYPAEWIPERLAVLCRVLEVIREAVGQPILILSGYRSPAYNEARRRNSAGVAKDSQHVHGRAADIRVRDLPSSDLHATILRLHREGKLPEMGGLGLYRGWVHVDVRPGDRLARWNGEGVEEAAA